MRLAAGRRAVVAALLALAAAGCGQLDLGGEVAQGGATQSIPPGAVRYRTFLMQAWQYYFQLAQDPAIGFAQVHQESRFDCSAVSPGGSRGCAQFLPATAEWVNKRLPADVRARCPVTSGCPMDPRWALHAMVEYDWWLWSRTAWAQGDRERWAFTLTQYNGGTAVVNAERKACEGTRGCNPRRYFDHVERLCGSAGRSTAACAENRQYPKLILDFWRPMYQRWLTS